MPDVFFLLCLKASCNARQNCGSHRRRDCNRNIGKSDRFRIVNTVNNRNIIIRSVVYRLHQIQIQGLVDQCARIICKRTQQNRRYHKQNDLENLAGFQQISGTIPLYPAADYFPVHMVNHQHKRQCYQHADTGSDCTSDCPPRSTGQLVFPSKYLHQPPCRQHADRRI